MPVPDKPDPQGTSLMGARSMLGPIHAFGSTCFGVFGVIYLVFIHSNYLFFSNALFGVLGTLNWFILRGRLPEQVQATSFLAIVYLGLINVAVHLGTGPLPMVFWGMSVMIAATFLFDRAGVVAWFVLTLAFYPLISFLKAGPLAHRVLPLNPSQVELLALATYAGLLSFLAYSFSLFRARLDAAVAVLRAHAAALSKSEALLAESQQVARVGSYDLALPEGTWTSTVTLDEILGIDGSYRRDIAGWIELMHPDDREAWRHYLTHDLTAASPLLDREYRLARKDRGAPAWVHGRGVVHRSAAGVPVRMRGTIQDISGFRRAEQERLALETRLLQAQKLESLGVLAGGIAHDFNNLLTVILANVNVSLGHAEVHDPELVSALHHVETAALRAGELTRQMLAFAGKGHFVVQPLDLNAAITEMAGLLKTSVSKKIDIRFALAASAPRIVADASQIRQVIMNLILNAAEAIGDAPGMIRLRTEVRTPGATSSSQLASSAIRADMTQVCLELVDTGCGMDKETQARIFEPFFTTKFTGRGLGLAAVLGIVKGHGGAISLVSAPGKGTTFTLLFPCAPTAVSGGAGQVLIVDDEALVRKVVRAALTSQGFEVFESADGAAALEFLRTGGVALDLVLLDLKMPKMDGVEVFGRIRQLRPELRVVVMSGYGRGEVLALFGNVAPNDFLSKPFKREELLAVVGVTCAAA